MTAKKYPTDILHQTQTMVEAWKRVDPAFKVGDLTPDHLSTGLTEVAPILAEIESLEARLIDLRNQRDAHYNAFWVILKRIRNAIKGIYGDDSSQYQMVGGKRLSDRKPVARKMAAPPKV